RYGGVLPETVRVARPAGYAPTRHLPGPARAGPWTLAGLQAGVPAWRPCPMAQSQSRLGCRIRSRIQAKNASPCAAPRFNGEGGQVVAWSVQQVVVVRLDHLVVTGVDPVQQQLVHCLGHGVQLVIVRAGREGQGLLGE